MIPPQSLFPDLKQVVTYFDAKKEATKNLTRKWFQENDFEKTKCNIIAVNPNLNIFAAVVIK